MNKSKKYRLCVAMVGAVPLLSSGCTVHQLRVSRYTNANLTNTEADQILADATLALRVIDGTGDVEANVLLVRDGDVTTFLQGNGAINSATDFSNINGLPGNVKVVNQINWCGGLAPNVIGCAPVPGNSFVVVRYISFQEGVLWAHEFGHNKGRPHRDVPHMVMRQFIGPTHRRINDPERIGYES